MTEMASARPIVLLLHGFAGLGFMNRPLGRVLQRAGYRTVEVGYDSWGRPLDQICERLLPRIAELEKESPAALHIVAHSMGGLVARALLHRQRPRNLGHVVMMGTPNGGSEIADFLDQNSLLRSILGHAAPALVTHRPADIDALLGTVDYPVGIIAGSRPILPIAAARLVPLPSDGKVSVASTHLPEATDHIVLPLPHGLLPYHPLAQRQVQNFLAHGRFFATDERSAAN